MRLIYRDNWPGFPIGVHVCFGGVGREMILDALERYGCSRSGCLSEWSWTPRAQTNGHCAVLPCHRIVLWFPTATPAARTIAHECFHAAYGALPQLGIKLCDETEEAFAYAIDNLYQVVSDMADRANRHEKRA